MSVSAEPATTDSVEVEESNKQKHGPQQEEEPVVLEKCDKNVQLICDQIIQNEKDVNESDKVVEQVQREEQEDLPEDEERTEKIQEPIQDEEEVTQEPMQLPMANTSTRAIEDEEMPSMVNISIPSKIDDSEANIKQDEEKRFIDREENNIQSNSKREEDNDNDSVYVIDDDEEDEEEEDEEEEEEASYVETDGSSSYHDDDDSVETAKHRYNDKYDRRRERNEKIGEDDTTEEDGSDSTEDDGDGGIYDGNGGSDDLLLRHSTCLLKQEKERSASLQDLTLIKGPVTKNKPSVNPYSQKARLERNQVSGERRLTGKQYAHVESKVKKYIMDMNEQRRLSGERRKKAQEETRFTNQELSEAPVRLNQEAAMTYKAIRDYTEKALKEVAECEENEEMYDVDQSVENGEISAFPTRSMSNGESVDLEEMDVDDQHEIELRKSDEKIDRMNGTASNENQNNYIYERKGMIRRDNYSSKPVLNGEDSSNPVCDLRSLTYEEYMKGSVDKEMNNEDIEEVQDISEKSNNNDIEPPCILQIESITSNYRNEEKVDDGEFYGRKTPSMMVNQSTETFYQESQELNALRYQLNQRNIQFDNLRDAYQKTMSENLAMKMELENLKKMVTYYQEQQKPISETKVIAVQTEEILAQAPSMPILEMDTNEQVDPKVSGSMNSAMSSQWEESTISAVTSIEPPPNITNVLISDDSQNQTKTSLKQKNAFSRAFITSSKILQTLSNITYGKSKKDSKTFSADTPQLNPSQSEPSNSKKRKATDTLEISSTAQPFKIPNIVKARLEKNEESTNATFTNPNIEKGQDSVTTETNEKDEEVQGIDDDVKVFVFPEDDNGVEHSFLIQAKEVTNNSKSGVRECGPYLLGNIEVFMTEMNGTINIWGKELSQISAATQNAEELETSRKSKDLKSNLRCQSTPRIFSNHTSASTGKKSKVVPRFVPKQPHHHQHSCEINNTVVECDHCNSHNHRLSWPPCNQNAHENHSSCCSPTVRTKETPCGCCHRNERQNIGMTCCKSQNYVNIRGCSLPNVYQDNFHSPCCCNNHHNHYKNATQDELHRHPTFVRRHSFNPSDNEDNDSDEEENAQNVSKPHQTLVDNSTHSCSNSNSMLICSNNRKSVGGNCSNLSPCQNENDPSIFQRQIPEAPEIRKRKLNGKKVRGMLLDLLKGCGDCRPTNPIDKTNPHQNTSMYEPSTSANYRPACHGNQQSCSVPINEKCSECRHRNSKTAELEAQLEFFRIEMDKLRSRSDTLREMLDTIRNEDITN